MKLLLCRKCNVPHAKDDMCPQDFTQGKDAPLSIVSNLHDADPMTERFQSAIWAVLKEERFDSLTVVQVLGTLDLVKASLIAMTPEKP